MTTDGARSDTEQLLRTLAPQVLAALTRRYGDFHAAEDAVQEALLAASQQWATETPPRDPRAWLIRVASRRLIDALRSDSARRRREELDANDPLLGQHAKPADEPAPSSDDTLQLYFLCCHPALTRASQLALTLRAVGGLTTAQVAAALLVPERTMAQRISRAKGTIRAAGLSVGAPADSERISAVLAVLYLMFNEGYAASSGPEMVDVDLCDEAIRLVRMLRATGLGDRETDGLLALLLLTDARRAARVQDGALVPLAEQDRSRWDAGKIEEGRELLVGALKAGDPGTFLLQAAIAAVHADAPTAAQTDWPQILELYRMLRAVAPTGANALGLAVAIAEVHGPRAGLRALVIAEQDAAVAGSHRLRAARGHLLARAGDVAAARAELQAAARMTASVPEQRYLHRVIAGL